MRYVMLHPHASPHTQEGEDSTSYLPEEDVLEVLHRHAAALLPLGERLISIELRLPLGLADAVEFIEHQQRTW